MKKVKDTDIKRQKRGGITKEILVTHFNGRSKNKLDESELKEFKKIYSRLSEQKRGESFHLRFSGDSAAFMKKLFIDNPKANKSNLVKKIIEKRVISCIEYTDPKLIEAAKIIDEVCGTSKLFNTLSNLSSALESLDSNGVARFPNGRQFDISTILENLEKKLAQAEQLMDRVNNLLDGVNLQGRVIYNKEKDNNNGDV
ncbi:hypothetical protein C1X72_15045 [Pseudomonas sp. FW306-2-2C-D06B]|uniref:hypothetical protein n=1 Tax=unclassified Pseudomonas TaxID=196821 RepID=UPI000C885469|nr:MULTISPECIES: hypothetical protein [unclassified Pseudomonas]PMY80463.1 hypothetical protein C1X72_15045 [Pseudomonas sp. FW306-2-2C-D06B]